MEGMTAEGATAAKPAKEAPVWMKESTVDGAKVEFSIPVSNRLQISKWNNVMFVCVEISQRGWEEVPLYKAMNGRVKIITGRR